MYSRLVSKPLVFVSCGQYTEEEKQLGKRISEIVTSFNLEPFFAEQAMFQMMQKF